MNAHQTKRLFPMELAWLLGVLTMAAGVACVSLSRFGYSMVIAPAYLLFAKLGGQITFGTAEYLLQGVLLLLLCLIIRRFRWQYLWAFATAVIYGRTFDAFLWLMHHIDASALSVRILLYALGTICISISVALFVRTYLAPEVYELFVREFAIRHQLPFGRVKLCYDCISCVLSILFSIALFGMGAFADFSWTGLGAAILDGYVLEGIGIGTVIAALINGPLITLCGTWLDRSFTFTKSEKIARFFDSSQ